MIKFSKKSSSRNSGERGSVTAAPGGSASKKRSDEVQDGLNWKKANKLALRATCDLKTSNGDSAAGILYKVESGGQTRYLFVSTHKRLLVKSPDDLCKAELLLHVLPEDECECIRLSRDKVCHVWNTRPHGEHTGNTVVELSDEAARACRIKGANFLRIGTASSGEEVRQIIPLRYCKNSVSGTN